MLESGNDARLLEINLVQYNPRAPTLRDSRLTEIKTSGSQGHWEVTARGRRSGWCVPH